MSGKETKIIELYRRTATAAWPNIEIKRRIRQVLRKRIRGIIYTLDKNLKTRMSGVPVLPFMLLLSTTHSQATFNQFSHGQTINNKTDTDKPSIDDDVKCVIIYVRVSTDEQKKNGRSIDSQIEELTSIVDRDPETILYQKPIKDEGETGTNFDRDGIQEVAKLAQNDEVTHLMVDTIDRIGRSVAETLMFVHELREKFDVKLMTRGRELDVRIPKDRLQVTMRATMADFGTRNRARSSNRSSADNFLKNNQWTSWYQSVPFGYELENEDGKDPKSKGWIRPVKKLEPVISDIYTEFIRSESYKKTARIINKKHSQLINDYYEERSKEDDENNYERKDTPLEARQIKSIVNRPVYRGEPTIPVTDFEHYDSYPSVNDPQLQFIDESTSKEAEKISAKIAEKYSTDKDLTIDPNDYPDEFNPYLIETVSPPVRLVCPECSSDFVADGHQRKLDGGLGSRVYKCSNDECEHQRRWPRESEVEMMKMISKFDELHSIL